MTTVAPPDLSTATGDADVRDAAAIDAAHWPHRPLTAPTVDGRDGSFQVVYRQSALDAIHLHGQTRTDVELCGVLLGTGCRDAHGPYLLVEHAIAGTAASSRSTNVTFTADTWQQIQTVMDRDFPDKKMIGWYHTHPGFGIFLSDMDVFICDNFFNLPWQVAFVYDPLGGDEGNFVWRNGKPTREPVLLEDDVTPASGAVPLMPMAEALTGSDPAEFPAVAAAGGLPPDAAAALQSQVIELMERVARLERRQRPLLVAVVFLLAFAAMWAVTQMPAAINPTPAQPGPSSAVSSAAQPGGDAMSLRPPPPAAPRSVPQRHQGR